MDIIKRGNFIFVVERVKNDKNGNPKYEILPIWNVDKPINFTYDLSFFGYRVKKDYSRVIVTSYNIEDDVVQGMYKDCKIKELIHKKMLTREEIEFLENFCRIDNLQDSEEIEIRGRLYKGIPLELRYKSRVYTIYQIED